MVLDASVWVAALIKKEQYHTESALFLSRLVQDRRAASVPILALVEVAAAIARQSRDSAAADTGLRFMRAQAWLSIYPVTESQGESAAAIAARQFLRGADAVYAALASQLGTPLVTWDKEMIERAAAVVPTLTPADWLSQNPGDRP
ncbi:MAG: PIN domain-containing protein [Betaproteobacteria bacterium]|nr:PIN domain-containing protein [Betaproteobacteria bacterium]